MNFVEEFETKMNEIKETHDEKIAEITDKMKAAITNKNKIVEEYDLYYNLGFFEEAIGLRTKIEAYDEMAKMYQTEIENAKKEVLISEDMHKEYSQEINKTYATKAGEAYKKVLKALNEARAALFEIKEINNDAHICAEMLYAVERYNDSGIDYPRVFSKYDFSISDYITSPLGFSTVGKHRTLEECCYNNDLFRILKLKVKEYAEE